VDDIYEPSTFVAMNNDLIVITLNYRLGAFGFMHIADTEASGNQGFLDQNLALKWIYTNAHRFGGDRERITLSGQSAGSFSVGYHLVYPSSWPYFRSAMLQSGSLMNKAFNLISSYEATSRAKEVLFMLGCDAYNMTNIELFECAQRIDDPRKFIIASDEYYINKMHNGNLLSSVHSMSLFPLVIDGYEFDTTIEEMFAKNQYKKCNLLIGHAKGEAGSFMAFSGYFGLMKDWLKRKQQAQQRQELKQLTQYINQSSFLDFIHNYFTYYPAYPNQPDEKFFENLVNRYVSEPELADNTTNYMEPLLNLLSDQIFVCPIYELAEIYSRLNDVFFYSYDHHISTSIYPEAFGSAVHGDDLVMMFGEPLSVKQQPLISFNFWTSTLHDYSFEERVFAKQLNTYWSSFVKHNTPNVHSNFKLQQPYWPTLKEDYKLMFTNGYLENAKNSYFLRLKANEINYDSDYSSHNCDFWWWNTK
jgi:carboxylesterase type B